MMIIYACKFLGSKFFKDSFEKPVKFLKYYKIFNTVESDI